MINIAQRPKFDPDSLVPLYVQAADYVASQILAESPDHGPDLEPVSGFEPLTCRLQEVLSRLKP